MPSASKKYKLLKSPEAGVKPVCAFFTSPDGCRNGDKCKFLHTKEGAHPAAEVSESASVISSESEGEAPNTAIGGKPVFGDLSGKNLDGKIPNDGGTTPSKKPAKKQKKPKNDPFANPKKRSTLSSSHEKISKKQKTNEPELKPKVCIEKSLSQPDSGFRSLVSKLPVASFAISPAGKGISLQKKPAESEQSVENSTFDDGLPIPTSTDVGRKWQNAVLKTRQKQGYSVAFDFNKYKELGVKGGLNSDWIKAKQFGEWCASNPQAIAIDCEMCETQDPLSGAKNGKALCRLSVVNAENPEDVLLDTLVKPSWPVTDYRTRINGISKENLENVEFTLRHAQAFMMALCSEETIIIGHAVHNDLVAMNMEHHCVVDSSLLFRAKDSPTASVSLKDLVAALLKEEMPKTHDSVKDARKALECVQYWMRKDGKVEDIERTSRLKGQQLFLHRISKECNTGNLRNMFLNHTSIAPVDVEEIEFKGDMGKCHVTFPTNRHANLAFDMLDGTPEADKAGLLQKKVFLKNGDYVRVRKMVHERHSAGTPNKTK